MTVMDNITIITKCAKLLLNAYILYLYRSGDAGQFMGASHNRNFDSERLACGVYIGLMIYNINTLLSAIGLVLIHKPHSASATETLMNFIGGLLWLITGALVIQFWLNYTASDYFTSNLSSVGIRMGCLSIFNSAIYFVETYYVYNNFKRIGPIT